MAKCEGTIRLEVVNMVKGMTTCKVCGRDFPLLGEDHYIARDPEKTGVVPVISGKDESIWFDAFDCPHCGCQNVMQSRKRLVCPCEFGICDECDHPGEDQEEQEDG